VAESIKQRIRSAIISTLIEKKTFEGKKKDVDYIKGCYKDKKNHFQNYSPPNPLS
jgi:hypothetical protein